MQLPKYIVEVLFDAIEGGMRQLEVEGAEEADGGEVDAEPAAFNEFIMLLCFEVKASSI